MNGVLVWADIPVLDLQRARRLYGDMPQTEMTLMPGGGREVAGTNAITPDCHG